LANTTWTKEQWSAIETRGCNLLVAAAAGAGKTAVLVERIIKMVTEGERTIDIDRLLVVTFTNAAAAEMRERIAAAISDALSAKPESKELQRQLTLLSKASITTIHSFCLQVIRNNFHRIDLDPDFRIGDETETMLLKQEILEELMEEKYDEENLTEGFIQLVESYSSNRDDNAIMDMILNLYTFAMSSPWPEKWLNEASEDFNVGEAFDFGESKWAKVLKDNLKIELMGIRKSMFKALGIINDTETLLPYMEIFQNELAMVEDMLLTCEKAWGNLQAEFDKMEFKTLKRCGKDVDKARQEAVKDIRDNYKKQLNGLKSDVFAWSSREVAFELNSLYGRIKCLCDLVLQFDEMYKERKKKKGIIDFNDIEHFCLKILTEIDEEGNIAPSQVALELREKYEEILIDEYQDSNLVQEVILGTVSRKNSENPNLFMVGDVKQSIYRFRQAKPELFLEKYNTYSDKEGNKSRRILLYKNFRSRKEVIHGTNFIFKQIMSRDIGELNYDDTEALNVGADYSEPEGLVGVTGGPIEINILEKKENELITSREPSEAQGNFSEAPVFDSNSGDEGEEELVDNIRLEARLVAQRINELMKSCKEEEAFKIFDKRSKEYRRVDYKDIVILLRATSAWAPVFVEELKTAGVPVYADTGTGYFDTTEIKTMLSLLQVIDNPLQDIPLIAVLRSPIAAFSAEELIDIRTIDTKVSFYETLKKAAELCENHKLIDEVAVDTEGQLGMKGFRNYGDFVKLPLTTINTAVSSNNETITLNNEAFSEGYNGEVALELVDDDSDIPFESLNEKECCCNESFCEEHSISKDLCKKVYNFLRALEYWRDRALHMPIDEFIWHLYTTTGYYGYAAAMPGGVQRQANLRILFQRAKQFEQTSYKGLFNFVNFINRLKVSSGDMGSAKILGENENVVRIMSIHKSKGLEFPVVILSGTGKSFNLMDMNKSVLFHHSLGFGPDYVDYERRISYPTIIKQAIRKKIKIESLSEEMRILYVALTRPKEKLIITGAVTDINKAVKKWSASLIEMEEKLSQDMILRSKSYLDWIGLSLMRHKDGSVLREIAWEEDERPGEAYDILKDESKWHIKTIRREEVLKGKIREVLEDEAIEEDLTLLELEAKVLAEGDLKNEEPLENNSINIDLNKVYSKYSEEIDRRLSFKYKYEESSVMPAKFSVTELKRQFSIVDEDAEKMFLPKLIKKPSFLEDTKGLSAAEKGTAMHSAMQHLDFKGDLTEAGIRKQIEAMVINEILTEKEEESIKVKRLGNFFKTDLAKRMLSSEVMRREFTFQVQLKSTDIFKELEEDIYSDEVILLQGAIDCYFEESDGLVLLDFKTDYVDNNVDEIRDRYKVQIEYYTKALEKITGKRVKEKYLYLFYSNEVVDMATS